MQREIIDPQEGLRKNLQVLAHPTKSLIEFMDMKKTKALIEKQSLSRTCRTNLKEMAILGKYCEDVDVKSVSYSLIPTSNVFNFVLCQPVSRYQNTYILYRFKYQIYWSIPACTN